LTLAEAPLSYRGMTGQTSPTAIPEPMGRETLTALVEARILRGDLAAGAKLPSERRLAEHFGVSRPVVREALRTLIERDLVRVVPGRGAFVRGAEPTDAAGRLEAIFRRRQATPRDLVEARTMLECTAAALAAERATPEDRAAIETALAEFDRSTALLTRARYDLAFHLAIARAAANPVVETMFGSIAGLTAELMLRSLSDPEVTRASVPFHWQIWEAIRDRDPARARLAMERHLAVAAQLYGADYDRSIESVARRELGRLLAPGVTLDDLLAETTSVVALEGREPDGRDG
jgi:GntR family transcriptional repressor for pyruvate dehydrogenase complex